MGGFRFGREFGGLWKCSYKYLRTGYPIERFHSVPFRETAAIQGYPPPARL